MVVLRIGVGGTFHYQGPRGDQSITGTSFRSHQAVQDIVHSATSRGTTSQDLLPERSELKGHPLELDSPRRCK